MRGTNTCARKLNRFWILPWIFFASFIVMISASVALAESAGVLNKLSVNKASYNTGDLVKITAEFENAGDEEVTAMLKGELYISGRLLDVINSDEMKVEPGETKNLTVYFTPDQYGFYSFYGYVTYAGRTTLGRLIRFKVTGWGADKKSPRTYIGTGPKDSIIPLAMSGLIALIVAGFVLLFRKKIPAVEY